MNTYYPCLLGHPVFLTGKILKKTDLNVMTESKRKLDS